MYSNNCESLAKSNVIKVSRSLKDILNDRFDDFNDKIYKSMKFYDPKFWDNADDTYDEDQITFLSEHFKVPLTKHSFILSKAIEEWQSFKVCVRENYSKFFTLNLWKMVLTNRKEEYPQLSLRAQLFLSISGSNSTVE